MCGLVAYYKTTEGRFSPQLFEQMVHSLEHRGRDDFGFCYVGNDGPYLWRDEVAPPPNSINQGVAMGHHRISIFDLTTAGRQPFVSSDGRVSLVFNGEIYNFIELREELENYGYQFSTDCDTEALLAAYHHWGPECFSRLNGAFAIIAWDNEKKTLVVARDRIGEKPLLYTQVNGDWVFASEVKALLSHPDINPQPNEQSILNFIALGHSPKTGETFFSGIRSLEPGTYLTFKNGSCTQTRYWDLNAIDLAPPRTEAEAIEQLSALLNDSVKLRMRGDLRVGAMLSGGMDSTSVITSMASVLSAQLDEGRSIGDSLQGFTACFPGEFNDESDKVEELCNRIEITANKFYPTEQDGLLDHVHEVSRALEAPFWSPVILVHDMMMKFIGKSDVHVVLDGLGADEMLGGYDWYIPLAISDDIRNLRFGSALGHLKGLQNIDGGNAAKEVIRFIMPKRFPALVDAAKTAVKGKGPNWRSGLLKKELDTHDPKRRPAEGKSRLARAQKDDLLRNNTPRWLHMGDNISMYNGVVSRSPFLDSRIVEFAFSLDNDMLIRDSVAKYILREAKRGQLPASIVNTINKTQFTGPGEKWLRGPLKEFTESLSNPKVSRITEYLRPSALSSKIDEFLAAPPANGYNYPIWRLVNTEAWLRSFF